MNVEKYHYDSLFTFSAHQEPNARLQTLMFFLNTRLQKKLSKDILMEIIHLVIFLKTEVLN